MLRSIVDLRETLASGRLVFDFEYRALLDDLQLRTTEYLH
jgi:hypothetical protein